MLKVIEITAPESKLGVAVLRYPHPPHLQKRDWKMLKRKNRSPKKRARNGKRSQVLDVTRQRCSEMRARQDGGTDEVPGRSDPIACCASHELFYYMGILLVNK
jgi:hypothetical protein